MFKGLTTRNLLQISALAVATAPLPAHAQTQTFRFASPAGPLDTALRAFARTTGQQVLFDGALVRGKRSAAISGSYTADQALSILLRGSGLTANRGTRGAWVIQAARLSPAAPARSAEAPAQESPTQSAAAETTVPEDEEGVPDILVIGRRNWSLNTGIQRTRDDAQPFVIFDQEQIKRTGATSLEQFLTTQLTSNATQGTSELGANAAGGTLLGRSRVDLRGLGERETLILIDGRRQPGLNNGSGNLEQPQITNIPLASIERIEVLGSSASGIYGVGATGGVINVILRRNYQGGELTFNYADTTDLKAPDRRVDLVLGKSIEGGRTNLSFSGTIRGSDPLTRQDREKFIVGASRFALANNPNFFISPPLGTTPNINAIATRANPNPILTLDPIYGGGSLGSNRTFVPAGFRGVALDGVAGLVANAGQYNLDLPDAAAVIGTGGRNPLVVGSDLMSGTFAVRREMNSWLRMYAEVFGSRSKSRIIGGQVGEQISLAANNPNNPFQQQIRVTVPIYGYDAEQESKTDQLRFVGGAIAKLGGDWQAALDVAYGQNWYYYANPDRVLSSRSVANLSNGTFNPLRDTFANPFVFNYIQSFLPSQDYKSDLLDVQLKIAGPLPITLPGGKPIVSLNLERSKQNFSESFGVGNSDVGGVIQYTPDRSERISSAYGEIRIPLIGDETNIPLVQELEITAAARYEQYKGRGSDIGFECFSAPDGFPEGEIDLSACDPDTVDFPEERLTNSHIDPTVALRWKVSTDLTLRASYATGYLPPRLGDLIRQPTTFIQVQASDPERGGEIVGTPAPLFGPGVGILSGFQGGNPDLDNEESESLTAGAILTPRFFPGLRLSVDYTRIEKTGNFANPSRLLIRSFNTEGDEAFRTFLRLFPERVTRGPASDGFAVGPITSIDISRINIAGATTEFLDFAVDYGFGLGGGTLDISASATHNLKSVSQTFPDSDEIDASGVVFLPGTSGQVFANGALKWRGVGSVRWSNDRASIGWRGRYVDGYYFNVARTVVLSEGSARLRSQFYQDIFASYRFDEGFTIRAGVNNFLNKKPPYIAGRDPGYSTFGDPRLANFYVNLSKAF